VLLAGAPARSHARKAAGVSGEGATQGTGGGDGEGEGSGSPESPRAEEASVAFGVVVLVALGGHRSGAM